MIRSTLFALALALVSTYVFAAYHAQPRDDTSLQGSWQVNVQASDNVDQLVAELIAREERERRQWRKRMEQVDPYALPEPEGSPDPTLRRKRENALRNLLGVTKTLKVVQNGTTLEIATDIESRRFETGSTSQSSMRNGDLADMNVGWDGEWFIVDRKVPGRRRQVERLRLIKKTGQLEYVSKWSGDDDLSGVKLRQVFDPVIVEPQPVDPNIGPVR